jgi:preprotein translocase subunit SecA
MGGEMFHRLERWIVLGLEWDGGGFRGINQLWREHLLNMDHLKEGIGLRGYGQRDPLTEYKKEAFDMFQEMIGSLKETAVEQLFKVRMTREDAPVTRVAHHAAPEWQESRGGDLEVAGGRPSGPRPEPRAADGQKVGRNDPCPCGSGKKYKKCCLLKGA